MISVDIAGASIQTLPYIAEDAVELDNSAFIGSSVENSDMAPVIDASAVAFVEMIQANADQITEARTNELMAGLSENLVFAFGPRDGCESEMHDVLQSITSLVSEVTQLAEQSVNEKAKLIDNLRSLMAMDIQPFASRCLPTHSVPSAHSQDAQAFLHVVSSLIASPEAVPVFLSSVAASRRETFSAPVPAMPFDPVVASLSEAAKEALAAHDFEALGREVGSLLAITAYDLDLIIPAGFNADEMALTMDGSDVKVLLFEMLRGFMRDFPNITACLDGTNRLIPQLRSAFNLIFSKKFANVKNGLASLARILIENVGLLFKCNKAIDEFKEILAVLSTLENPSVFAFKVGKHLIINGRDILTEVFNAAHGFRQEDYEMAGFNIGLALHHAIIGENEEDQFKDANGLLQAARRAYTSSDASLVVTGLVRGFVRDYPKLEKCINASERVIIKLEDAVESIATKTYSGVKNGVVNMATLVLVDLEPTLKKCKAAEEEFKKLQTALEKLKSAKGFFFTVGRHLLVEGVDIFSYISNAVNAYKAQEFELFGLNTGMALKHLLIGEKDAKLMMRLALENGLELPMQLDGAFELTMDADQQMVDFEALFAILEAETERRIAAETGAIATVESTLRF